MAEEQSMRLKQAATKFNVSTSTIIQHLESKGFEVENKPTTKITGEQVALLNKAFATDEQAKMEAEAVGLSSNIIRKAPEPVAPEPAKPEPAPAPKPEPKAQEEKPRPAAPEAKPAPVAEKPAEKAPEPPEAPKAEQAATTPEAAKPEKASETTEPAEPVAAKPGLKILGKIDLDSKGRPKKKTETEAKKPAEKAPEKAPEPKPAPAAEKPAKQAEEAPKPTAPETKAPVKAETKPATEPKAAEPKKPATPAEPKAEKPAPAPAPPKQADKPASAPAAESTPPATPDTPAANPTIVAKADQLKGLTVLGKIELPKDPVRGGKGGKGADAEGRGKRKRKRIVVGGGAQGAGQGQQQGGGQQRPGDRAGQGGQRPGQPGGQRSGPGNRPARPGQGNQRVEKAELTDKEIQDQIKATLAKLSGGGSRPQANRSKYRREKRSSVAGATEERRAQEELESKTLRVTEFISANDLASLMDVSVNDVIKVCLGLGMFISINQRLDAEAITVIADEFGYDIEFTTVEAEAELTADAPDAEEDLQDRPPIVTIMGHVDHGKTSLLDYIRNARVAAGEAGGITQHIGAYSVTTEAGKAITFLDTPGHEAFTAMRARGAKVTDVVIIVVAADDNVMPQTKEAINHAQAAGSPIVVAINKIDKPGANPDKIREELSQMNILVEEWGGKYQCQEISAKTGQGIDDLLEKVLLEAEILELKANPDRKAVGTIIEASLDKGRGYVATVLVQNGTLEIGDIMLAGAHYGRVKAMTDHRGKKLKKAGPSTPVQVLGLDGAPQAGDKFVSTDTEREAREIANSRSQLQREQSIRTRKHLTLAEIGRRLAIGNFKELNLIVRGDVDGSVEALSDSLLKLSTPEVQVNILSKGVGQISETDVLLASASDAIIVGFQVRPSQNARKLAEQEQIDIRLYSIIYNAINEVKTAMEGMLAPTVQEVVTCNVDVREVFNITKVGTIAGCMVTDGVVTRNTQIRLIRDGIVVHSGNIAALKRFKDDVSEVRTGYECGISLKNFNDIQVGDTIEGYEEKEIKRTL